MLDLGENGRILFDIVTGSLVSNKDDVKSSVYLVKVVAINSNAYLFSLKDCLFLIRRRKDHSLKTFSLKEALLYFNDFNFNPKLDLNTPVFYISKYDYENYYQVVKG